jgi:hypothetical protein
MVHQRAPWSNPARARMFKHAAKCLCSRIDASPRLVALNANMEDVDIPPSALTFTHALPPDPLG